MEMPTYDQYGKWFGEGPLSTHYGMQQMDLAKQFENQKLLQEQEGTKAKQLKNLYDEQNNPLLLENQQMTNRKLGYEADDAGVKSRINTATEDLQLDATQKAFIQKAKQSDLDMMEIEGQRMAYSPDPQVRAQGEQLIKMHKDFVKLREEGRIRSDLEKQKFSQDQALERQRAANARALAQTRGASSGGGNPQYQSTDKMRGYWLQKLEQARGANNPQAYEEAAAMLEYITQLRASERPDTNAGKPTISPEGGIAPIPARPAPVVPPLPGATTNQPKRKPLGEY